jgi:hypothetical protein
MDPCNAKGPGYMGWKIPEDDQRSEAQTFQQRLEEMKLYYDKLKNDFVELKKVFEEKFIEKSYDSKIVKKLNNEIAKFKDDDTVCMKAIQTETFVRNKAEEIARVLRDTVEIKESEMDAEEGSDENIDTEDDGTWTLGNKRPKKKLIGRRQMTEDKTQSKRETALFNCHLCGEKYGEKSKLSPIFSLPFF